VMDPGDLLPGSVWGDLLAGEGKQLPDALDDLETWWAEHVGTDRFSGSARPVLLAHDAFTVRQRLKEYMPLVEELFSHTLDISSVEAVCEDKVAAWDGLPFPNAYAAALDAWNTHAVLWRRLNQPAPADA
jgi:hypothetical protein